MDAALKSVVHSGSRLRGDYTVGMAVFSFWMIVAFLALIGAGLIIWLVLLFSPRGEKEKDDV